jgi:hypothetical protein
MRRLGAKKGEEAELAELAELAALGRMRAQNEAVDLQRLGGIGRVRDFVRIPG